MRFFYLLPFFYLHILIAITVHAPEEPYKEYCLYEDDRDIAVDLYPYITGTSYRAMADHVIDSHKPYLDLDAIHIGDSIYCAVWYLPWFFKEVHDQIPCPYVLITCDVDSYQPKLPVQKALFDPKLVRWYSRNMFFSHHPKFVQLPMGQAYHLWRNSFNEAFSVFEEYIAKQNRDRDILLYLNFSVRDEGRRRVLEKKYAHKPYCYSRNCPRRPCPFEVFWEEMSRSKFVLSPLGLEIDCTRTWESFVLGAIPVVEHSFLDSLYEDLPILFVHNWDGLSEEYLTKKYQELSRKSYQLEKTRIDYWKEHVRKTQEEIRTFGCKKSALEETLFSEEDLDTIESLLEEEGKAESPILYQGVLTTLRPFQLSRKIPSLERIFLVDLWTRKGFSWMKWFAKDPTLVQFKSVQSMHGRNFSKALSIKSPKSVFFDLTHFQHKLLFHMKELDDFAHSLEKDLEDVYTRVDKRDFLFGNMISVPYVQSVLERLEKKLPIQVKVRGNFWYLVSRST